MMATVIRVGDMSSHGGTIITGSPTMTVDGKPIARIGDLHSCPQFYPGGVPHAVTPIIAGAAVIARPTVDGRPVAVNGDITGCGATLLPSSFNAQIS